MVKTTSQIYHGPNTTVNNGHHGVQNHLEIFKLPITAQPTNRLGYNTRGKPMEVFYDVLMANSWHYGLP